MSVNTILDKTYKEMFNESELPMLIINSQNAILEDFNKAAMKYYFMKDESNAAILLEDFFYCTKEEMLEKIQVAIKSAAKELSCKHLLPNGDMHEVKLKVSLYEKKTFSYFH